MQKTKQLCLLAACTGKAVGLQEVPDEAFSSEILGKGFAIEPSDGTIYAPLDARVESVAESKHAYTLLCEDGLDVLIHIGVDTVGMQGQGFVSLVKAGQQVRAGERIAQADVELIRSKGLSAICSVVITNPERLLQTEYRLGACTGGKNAVMCVQIDWKG